MQYVIDAKNQTLGRLATKIALILQGKDKASYDPAKITENTVLVKNIRQIKISGSKAETKVYQHHTGYMGHLRTAKYKQVKEAHPERILEHAVRGMLPKNFIRDRRMHLMIIEK